MIKFRQLKKLNKYRITYIFQKEIGFGTVCQNMAYGDKSMKRLHFESSRNNNTCQSDINRHRNQPKLA